MKNACWPADRIWNPLAAPLAHTFVRLHGMEPYPVHPLRFVKGGMMVDVVRYQVNTRFAGLDPYVWVNLYDETGTQVGRIELENLAQLPLLRFALEQLRTGNNVAWNDSAMNLVFGTEVVGEG